MYSDNSVITSMSDTAGVNDFADIDIYGDNGQTSYTNDTFSVKSLIDEHFGGFSEPIFYDYVTLFVIIIVTVFFMKLFSIFFSK